MTLVIAHGQPKSGSTFLYMAALEIAQKINDEEFYNFKNRVFGEGFPTFVNEMTADFLLDAEARIPSGSMFLIKTHAKLTDDVAELIEAGRIGAFTSFRDPRDAALSTLNVGEKDREKGVDRWFAKIKDIEQLSRAINTQTDDAYRWVRQPGVFAIPYYITAMSQSTSVGLLADYLGVPHLKNILAAKMDADREKLPEFNKGVLDRFVDEFPVEDLRFANETWAHSIAEYDVILEQVMARLGHRMAHAYFTGIRDQKIRERLSGA